MVVLKNKLYGCFFQHDKEKRELQPLRLKSLNQSVGYMCRSELKAKPNGFLRIVWKQGLWNRDTKVTFGNKSLLTDPDQHTQIIMECLDEAEITLPAKDQSTVLPVEGRPMATPRKRVIIEETSASGSGKKRKTYRTNPYIDDEAECFDDDHKDNDHHQENNISKAKDNNKTNDNPEHNKNDKNLEGLAEDVRLKRIDVPIAPQLLDDTNKEAVTKYIVDIHRYHDNGERYRNLGLLIQYAGAFRLFCLCETIKKDYPGFHATVVDFLKKCNYKYSKIDTLKAAGRKFNLLLQHF
ncbi:uncharacterized protein EV154DRAFT_484471 [Mucor mucedo]|uniref:uncharacterized protein n=1 Tax=Mucor mucedo TaxID=29922 RepID=UPI0022201649|nr:uncharacterized protein EV154DRAFT_484471 [Mucor mucedo]KAI7888068.1 hypothetical protein EV154DRAFT_484471 [Mucor mucedo]